MFFASPRAYKSSALIQIRNSGNGKCRFNLRELSMKAVAVTKSMVVVGLLLALVWCVAADAAPPNPADLPPGSTYHVAFVTSTTRDAASTDIADYNAFVQGRADAAGIGSSLGITWKVIGSTATAAANVNALVSGPVYGLDGVKIADDYADMWDGSLDSAIDRNEFNGSTVPPAPITLGPVPTPMGV